MPTTTLSGNLSLDVEEPADKIPDELPDLKPVKATDECGPISTCWNVKGAQESQEEMATTGASHRHAQGESR